MKKNPPTPKNYSIKFVTSAPYRAPEMIKTLEEAAKIVEWNLDMNPGILTKNPEYFADLVEKLATEGGPAYLPIAMPGNDTYIYALSVEPL